MRFVEGGIRVPNLSERDVAGACTQLVNHGVPIYQVLRTHRSLEEIFISITGRGGRDLQRPGGRRGSAVRRLRTEGAASRRNR